jgi:hypothetical protein
MQSGLRLGRQLGLVDTDEGQRTRHGAGLRAQDTQQQVPGLDASPPASA